MNYNANDALEHCRALASLIDHHHVPHHIVIDNSFTYDYAVSKCRYRAQKEEDLLSQSTAVKHSSFTIHGFEYCIIRCSEQTVEFDCIGF